MSAECRSCRPEASKWHSPATHNGLAPARYGPPPALTRRRSVRRLGADPTATPPRQLIQYNVPQPQMIKPYYSVPLPTACPSSSSSSSSSSSLSPGGLIDFS